jgi:3-hydroxybutyrate dehydrogenase
VKKFLAGKQPSGEFVETGNVAALIAFLCGDVGRDITGAALPIDGGWSAS